MSTLFDADDRRLQVVFVAYVVFVALYFVLRVCGVIDLKPHEFGDLLAGLFGPPAFFLLYLGYRSSSADLKGQMAQLTLSTKAQMELVETMRAQIDEERAQHREVVGYMYARTAPLVRVQLEPTLNVDNKGLAVWKVVFKNIGTRCVDFGFSVDRGDGGANTRVYGHGIEISQDGGHTDTFSDSSRDPSDFTVHGEYKDAAGASYRFKHRISRDQVSGYGPWLLPALLPLT